MADIWAWVINPAHAQRRGEHFFGQGAPFVPFAPLPLSPKCTPGLAARRIAHVAGGRRAMLFFFWGEGVGVACKLEATWGYAPEKFASRFYDGRKTVNANFRSASKSCITVL